MTTKHNYQILLPALHNDGVRNYEEARRDFAKRCIDLAGGVTEMPSVQGAYKMTEGQIQRELIFPVQVIADGKIIELLTNDAFDLFPDQEAFAITDLGPSRIVERAGRDLTLA